MGHTNCSCTEAKHTPLAGLCGDYKVSLNPQLQVNQYPLPHPDELFAAMNGGQKFTTLDLLEAYLQIELEEKLSQKLYDHKHPQGSYY